jgi:LPS export ABC transporter protein LptC
LSLKNPNHIIITLGVILFQILLLSSCGKKGEDPVETAKQTKEFPEQEGWNSELYISKVGRPQAIVHYGHMTKYETQKIIYFDQGVDVDFYDSDGNHSSHLVSDRGEYHEKTEDVIGLGDVVVVSDSGVTLMTEVIKWNNKRGKILSDTLVTIITDDQDTLYGKGLESEPDLGHWVIIQPRGISQRRLDIDNLEQSFEKTPARKNSGDIPNGEKKKE